MVTMNMMKTIKKRMLPVVLAGSLLIGAIGANPAIAQDQKPEPKVNVTLTRVQKDSVQKEESRGINCAEILAKNLPFNSDIYTVFEDYGNSYYAKFRLQSLPVKFKNTYLGLAAQHKNSTSFDSYNQFGLVGRLQGAPTENTFGKIDLRYFPRKNEFDTYAFIDTKRIFADVLAGYNCDSKKAYVIPGIDYKFNKHISAGFKTKFSGEGKLEKNYVGLRFKLNF